MNSLSLKSLKMKAYQALSLVFLVFISINSQAQKGPGGVSVETNSAATSCGATAGSTCGLWLDASMLTTLSDGDDVDSWTDVSISKDCDAAVPQNNASPPYFRDNPAYTINGLPVVTFDDGRFLLLPSTDDLNTSTVSFDQTLFFAFRTSTDVTTKQMLYEEGGTVRGFNILIENNEIIIGAYDWAVDNDGGVAGNADNTPAWGYTYVSRPITENTTYILTAQLHAETAGIVNNTTNYLKGWLNGVDFGGPGNMNAGSNTSFVSQGLVGSLYDHPNPCGLGAVNDDTVDRDGVQSNGTGTSPFQGRLGEMCYYRDPLLDVQRVIIENYLGAKYLSSPAQDKYEYEVSYGSDVIGIGRLGAGNEHNLSQGRSPFLISTTLGSSDDQFFFMGHDGGSMAWIDYEVPNESPNINRLDRIWRGDRTNLVSTVNFTVNSDDLPAAPAGFSKLVLLIDETNLNFPNFSLETTEVKELYNTSGTSYSSTGYSIPDGAFFTLAWLKPEVSLSLTETFTIEEDSPADFDAFVEVSLNYDPIGNIGGFTVDYLVNAGTALRTTDFDYTDAVQGAGINIPVNNRTAQIPLKIINDNIAEDPATEEFSVIILSGSNTTSGLQVGEQDTLAFTIYDDDPTPKFSFAQATSSVSEGVGTHNIDIVRTGDTGGAASCRFKYQSAGTTARTSASGLDPDDVDFTNGYTVNFADGENLKSVSITILNDEVDEEDEIIQFKLYSFSGAGVTTTSILNHYVTIVDDDPLPVAILANASQEGFEAVGSPVLFVTLDRYSSKDVLVDFTMAPGSTDPAIYNSDYSGVTIGTVGFLPFTDEGFLGPFFVDSDGVTETPENVEFTLTGASNATLDLSSNSTEYTIIDYSDFEYQGAAGVGKTNDNIVWIDTDRMTTTGAQTSLTNWSPYNIAVTRVGDSDNEAQLITSVAFNNRKVLDFDGNSTTANADCYKIDNNAKINTAGFVEKMSYFFVMRPESVPTTTGNSNTNPSTGRARLIYEQGGGTRGTSIYIYNGRLYFHAWNDNDDGDESPWGYDNGAGTNDQRIATSVYAYSTQTLTANETYVVSCHYDNSSSEPMMVYINGVKGTMSQNLIDGDALTMVGRLYGHSGAIGLGAVTNAGRMHWSAKDMGERVCAFNGQIGEFIQYHEPQFNETRRIIVENYLSAKFDIALDDSDTPQIFPLSSADRITAGSFYFNNEVTGLGQNGVDNAHVDAQSTSVLRINSPNFKTTEAYMIWGHNGNDLTNTSEWSYSNGQLPSSPNIEERSGQVWRAFEGPGDAMNTATLLIDFSASTNAAVFSADQTLLKLLVHNNADPAEAEDFTNATVYDLDDVNSGNIAVFENIPIVDGMYFTLGNTSPINITPLPIELLSFDAKLNGNHVDLNWITSTEINNDYFVIERAGGDLIWNEILTQPGAGNSNTQLAYSDVDRFPLNGVSYYRLKQIDFDGAFTYSDVISVRNTAVKTNDILIYPNPNNTESVTISISQLDENPMTITMTDISGKIILKEVGMIGQNIANINYGSVPAGVYLINVNSNSINETKKLIVE